MSFLSSPSFDVQKEFYPELLSQKTEGDIFLPPQYDSRNAIRLDSMKWPKGRIPYVFNDTFDDPNERKMVRDAMKAIESKTCIKFVPRENDTTYISVNKDQPGCYAMVGYQPKYSPLPVNLESPGCLKYQGTVQHELLHVIGLFHEQSRPDRDQYVKIMWENIDKNYHKDFNKGNYVLMTTHNLGYDMGSVMHYPGYAFSINGKPTIESKPQRSPGFMGYLGMTQDVPHVQMGQRVGATDTDLAKVRKMYNCPENY